MGHALVGHRRRIVFMIYLCVTSAPHFNTAYVDLQIGPHGPPANQLADDVWSHLLGLDTMRWPDVGNTVETIVAQWLIVRWLGDSVVQYGAVHPFDWTWTPPTPSPFAWAPVGIPQDWECKMGSIHYMWSSNKLRYLYTETEFHFTGPEVARMMSGATAWLLFVFMNRTRRVMWYLRVSVQKLVQNTNNLAAGVPAAQQDHPCIKGKAGNKVVAILGNALGDDPARVNNAGVVIPGRLPDPLPTPRPDVYFQVTAADELRTRQKCTGEGPGDSYRQPFAWLMGQDIDGTDTVVP
jgi:hypothetical protein